MKGIDDIKRLWAECFPAVSPRWLDALFERGIEPGDILAARDASGCAVSSLLLQPYQMTFHGETLPVSCLSFACTAPRYRGLGSMRQLMAQALETSRERGDMAVALVPPADWLRGYYERAAGFSTVFYLAEDNYTSVHDFGLGQYSIDCDAPADELYDAFSRLERLQASSVLLHTRRQFDMARLACEISGGSIVAARDPMGEIAAVAVAVHDDFYKVVTIAMSAGDTPEALGAALEGARLRYPGKRIRVLRPASDSYDGGSGWRRLLPGGMLRIVNAELALDAVAKSAPAGWAKTVKVTDTLIAANSHTYLLRGGRGYRIDDTAQLGGYDTFDISITVLAQILFGSAPIARLLDIPASRPALSLMP